MKKLALALILLTLSACASDKGAVKPGEAMDPLPLWQLISSYRVPGENPMKLEDDWYIYKLELAYIDGKRQFSSPVFSSCPVGEARYTVRDRESGRIITQKIIPQTPCDPCHKR